MPLRLDLVGYLETSVWYGSSSAPNGITTLQIEVSSYLIYDKDHDVVPPGHEDSKVVPNAS